MVVFAFAACENNPVIPDQNTEEDNAFKVKIGSEIDGRANQLFIIDGEPIKAGEISEIYPEQIKSIRVMEGQRALKEYGETDGKRVIKMEMNRDEETSFKILIKKSLDPVYYVNGLKVTEVNELDPKRIESIKVEYLRKAAAKELNSKTINKVVKIKLKD